MLLNKTSNPFIFHSFNFVSHVILSNHWVISMFHHHSIIKICFINLMMFIGKYLIEDIVIQII